MEIKKIKIGEPIPKDGCFFNGQPYKGSACFINGYNGYTSTYDDAMLCALINNSCFDSKQNSNLLTDKDGNYIKAKHLRNKIIILI